MYAACDVCVYVGPVGVGARVAGPAFRGARARSASRVPVRACTSSCAFYRRKPAVLCAPAPAPAISLSPPSGMYDYKTL